MRELHAVSEKVTLAAAQLATARLYGFPSWKRLKEDVELRALSLAEKAREFVRASVGDWSGRAAQLLAETPELSGYDFRTAVVLGDVVRVRRALTRDGTLPGWNDPETGWTALHLACGSRWHALDPNRTAGLAAVARLLLDAGADLNERIPAGARTPLACATATASTSAANEPLLSLLLQLGAIPDDHDLYMVSFAPNAARALRLLLAYIPDVRATVKMALSAPISRRDQEALRILLEAGADPRRYHNDDGDPASAVRAAIDAGCDEEVVTMLIEYGADATDTDVPTGLRAAAARRAAETGDAGAIRSLLDTGLEVNATIGGDRATLLHMAAYAGSAEVVRLLLESRAVVEVRDQTWSSTPLGWAMEGSKRRVATNAAPEWAAVVGLLLEAGASTEGIDIPDGLKPV